MLRVMSLLLCSIGRLPLATQQLQSLAAMDLSSNNATGALSCDNINPTLLALDLSHNGQVLAYQ